jgi:ubiquinone/menaquinone biosynthesis C-methylase UbiE
MVTGSPPDGAQLRQKQQMRELFDEVADVYATAEFFSQFGRSLIQWSGITAGLRVLDLAAGRGAILNHLEEAKPALALAVDLSARMVTELQNKARGTYPGQTGFAVMDAETLALADESFDVVLCGFALNMIPRPDQALREAYRVLRPGGLLAASVPAPALSNPFPPYSALIARFGQLIDPLRWTISELARPERALADAGFRGIAQLHDETAIQVRDPAKFWDMEMAHGLRGFFRALPAAAQDEFRREFHRVVASPRGGTTVIGRGALYLRGRKPGPVPEAGR